MQNSISTAGDHRALVGAYTTSFTIHVPALLRANRLYFLPTMQTSSRKPILNWYPKHFPGPMQAVVVVVYRPIDVFHHAMPRGVFIEQKQRRDLRNPFSLNTNNTERLAQACVKAIPRREALTTAGERPLHPTIFLINLGPVSEIRS